MITITELTLKLTTGLFTILCSGLLGGGLPSVICAPTGSSTRKIGFIMAGTGYGLFLGMLILWAILSTAGILVVK